MENDKAMNLFQKLLEIQREVIGLKKDGAGFNYSYVTDTKIIDNIKPIMNRLGLLLKEEIVNFSAQRIDYVNKKNEPKSEMFFMLNLKFTWVDCDSKETDVSEFAASGMNDWEKGLGSALTYAERYFFLKYFHISTDQDDIDNPERKAEEAKKAEEQEKQQQFQKDCKDADIALQNCKTLPELAEVFGKLPANIKKAIVKIKDEKKKLLAQENK